MKTKRKCHCKNCKINSKIEDANAKPMRIGQMTLLIAAIIYILFAWSSPANASSIHYVVDTDYRDVLVSDVSATRACTAMARISASMTQVVFTRSNKAFFWSNRTPDRFYTSLGWSDCQGWRRIEPANGRDDAAD